MFAKNCPVLGKTVLSGKDSKTLREQLLSESHCLRSISGLWSDLAATAQQTTSVATTLKDLDQLCALIAAFLGVPTTGTCAFVGEVVQGTVRGTAGTADGIATATAAVKVNFAMWSVATSNTPLLMQNLGEGAVNASKVALPAPLAFDSLMSLTLAAQTRVAQLWQLVLAAVPLMIEERNALDRLAALKRKRKEAAAALARDKAAMKKAAQQQQQKKKQQEDSEEEEEEEDDDDSSSSESESSSSASSDVEEQHQEQEQEVDDLSTLPRSAIIFRIAKLLFGRNDTMETVNLNALRFAPAVPCVQAHYEVCVRLIGGSDLMAVGTWVHRLCARHLPPTSVLPAPVAIVPVGHFVPIALGTLSDGFVVPVWPEEEEQQQEEESSGGGGGAAAAEDAEPEGNGDDAAEAEEAAEEEEEQEEEHQEQQSQVITFQRGAMSSSTAESKAVRISTMICDTLSKLHEVAFVKASVPSNWFVFATASFGASEQVLMSLLGRIAEARVTDDEKKQKEKEQQQQQKGSKKPIPKKAGGKKGGGNNNSNAAAAESSTSSSSSSMDPVPVQQLAALLQECQPGPWPAGFTMATPPRVAGAGPFANNAASLAVIVAHLCSTMNDAAAFGDDNDNEQHHDGKSSCVASSSAAASLSPDDIMCAAAFTALAGLTKESLPLPLSKFGALLQDSLRQQQRRGGKQQHLVDWPATRWKKPITFFREISKQFHQQQQQQQQNSGGGKKKNASSAPEPVTLLSGYDATNDFVIDLKEDSPGNFLITNINKTSRLFRDHKRSTDAAHELVRHVKETAADDDGGADGDDGDSSFVSSTHGRIAEIKQVFVSHRSSLPEDLDVILFSSEEDVARNLAALAEFAKQSKADREIAKFPSLGDAAAAVAASSSSAASAPASAPPPAARPTLLEFVTIDDATRRVAQFARAAGCIVINTDLADPAQPLAKANAKAGDVKVQQHSAFCNLWSGNSAKNTAPVVATVAEILRRVGMHVHKATMLRFLSGHTELRKGTPPALQLGAKRVHNHWVTTLTGPLSYYFDVNAVMDAVKRRLACSARVEENIATLTQPKSTVSLVLTGNHIEDLQAFLRDECGVDPVAINVIQGGPKPKPKGKGKGKR